MNSQIFAKVNNFIKNRLIETTGVALIIAAVFLVFSIVTYSPSDPNFIYTPENTYIKNWGGFFGSVIADFLLQAIGLVSFLIVITLLSWGFEIIKRKKITNITSKIFFKLTYIVFGTSFSNIFSNQSFWLIDNGNSGFVGRLVKENLFLITNSVENKYFVFALLVFSIIFFVMSLSLKLKEIITLFISPYVIIKKILKFIKKEKRNDENLNDTNLNSNTNDILDDTKISKQPILPFSTKKIV